ncbi:CpXC domain-containing protein [Thermoflexus sp.]|uniref:CpXC domain-containing protein n=3 Tax=Thermoflexus sp. TaxID=1969742 RepID=UPI002637993F|nr:CpXC domain-containing protein [Thermoflexus sp.]MCX7690835.1 CpXC domain-containing protein [Thermoflexus sp.]MDW8185930.1 CpXC domain-containing protein [Anaerolineae bacterium]
MPFPPASMVVRCPFCGQPVQVQVRQIIDVSEEPHLKRLLLAGRLNAFVCPRCGNRVSFAAPFLYHDPEKELALVFIPIQANLKEADRQRIVGQLTDAILRQLPREKRKAYLLQPKEFFTIQSLLEAILRADGYTDEDLQAMEERALLLQRILNARRIEDAEELIRENAEKIDAEFFRLFHEALATVQEEGSAEELARVMALRDRLLERTPYGQTIRSRTQIIEKFTRAPSGETLLEALLEAPDPETRQTLVALGRPFLDYRFFQNLTRRIEEAEAAGQQEEAERLIALRREILEAREAVDLEIRRIYEERARLIQELLSAPSERELQERLVRRIAEIDDIFFDVLQMNIEAALKAGDTRLAQALNLLGQIAMTILQQMLPPELRLLNALLNARSEEHRRQILERNRRMLTPEFQQWLHQMEDRMREEGRAEMAERIAAIRSLAEQVAATPVILRPS